MQSSPIRFAVVGLLITAAVILFILLSGGDADDAETLSTSAETAETDSGAAAATQPEPRFDVIIVRNGEPVGGVQRFNYGAGEMVRLEVRLDEPYEEIHVHGYDIARADVRGTQRLTFQAELEGIFELEAHGPMGDVLLGELAVLPE